MTQSKAKDLVKRQDRLEVKIEVLMGTMDKLNIEMISRHNIHSCKENKVKVLLNEHFLFQIKVAENSGDDKKNIVNHGRKFCTHQISYIWPLRESLTK